ncbi:DUF4838 domain-containing protein [candidate division KSB1 bacterium]|nr:DUF4838 domain-containing protein [candidate division KSB1 bacterium]
MRFYNIFLLFLILLAACSSPKAPLLLISLENKCTIMLDIGSFENVDQAVAAAAQIDWFDENPQPDVFSTTALAARELAFYLEKICDVPVPIVDDTNTVDGTVIFLGYPGENTAYPQIRKRLDRQFKKLNSTSKQGYFYEPIRADEQSFLLLCGQHHYGTLYAVYHFLQNLGIHWFESGKNGEYVTKTKVLEVQGEAEYFEPLLQQRGYFFNRNKTQIIDKKLVEWLGHNFINYFPYDSTLLHLYKQRGISTYGGSNDQLPAPLNPEQEFHYNHSVFVGDEKKPDCPYPVSATYSGDKNNDGVLAWQEAYPDWYGETSEPAAFKSFCITRQHVLEELANNIVKQIKATGKNIDIWNLFFPDQLEWCTCNDCRAIGEGMKKALFLHRFLCDAVNGKLDRNIQIYSHFSWRHMDMAIAESQKTVVSENIPGAIVIKINERCYTHTISDTNCTEVNQAIYRQLEEIPRRIDPVYVEEVYNDPGINDLPVVFSRIISKDIPQYAELGFKGMYYSHAKIFQPGVYNLLNFQLAAGTWEPTRLDSLTQEYFDHYYLNVAKYMQTFYSQMEQCLSNIMAWKIELAERINNHILNGSPQAVYPLVTFKNHFDIEETFHEKNDGVDWEKTNQLIYEAHFSLADAMSEPIPERLRQRIIELEHQRQYAELTIQLYDNVLRILTLEESEPEMKEEAQLRLGELVRSLRQFKVTTSMLGQTDGLTVSGIAQAVEHLVRYPR